jgi:elongation factor G
MSDARKLERPILTVSFHLSGTEIEARGMDELRLAEFCGAICRDNGDVFDGVPKVILLEALQTSGEGEGKYIRQTGGSGNYGHCKIRLSPSEPGSGYEFINDIKNDAIPEEFIEPIDMGIREAMDGGILAGCPVLDVTVTLYDGSFHEADSNPMAFQIAGSMAFKEAAKKANPVLMEPMMAVEATLPVGRARSFIEDLNARHGRIEAVERRDDSATFKALVPLSETLRASARGRMEFPLRFERYEPVANTRGPFGDGALGAGVRNLQRPILGPGSAAAELYFGLD